MSSQIATFVCVLGIIGLIWLDWDRKARTSKALWIPVLWLAIAGSRPISQWLESGPSFDSPDQILDGSPVDRAVLTLLLILGVIVLARRIHQVAELLRSNLPLLSFFIFCAVSVFWSEFSDVALKRWVKAVGDLVMVLIVLTDVDYHSAVKRLLSWTGFILVPVSILFIKYYPNLGRAYNRWTWTPSFGGVTTGKNTLGMICMLLGLGSLWRFLVAYRSPSGRGRNRQLITHGTVLLMVLWLFGTANSITSLSCFVLVASLMAVTNLSRLARRHWVVHLLVAGIVLGSFSTLFLDVGSSFVEDTMARDPATLTGRTDIWKIALSMAGNPVVGTGFESFWLGKRLQRMWGYNRDINQAHNGYLEIYLNLGWIGVILLSWMLVTGYRKVIRAIRWHQEGSLWLAYFVVAVVYNFTEAAFKMMSPIWILFLLAMVAASRTRVSVGGRGPARVDHALPSIPLPPEVNRALSVVSFEDNS
jgi:exopolysaccharide production protein ExoQ